MEKQHFFIVGCQRTGTTLMRLVLECHSKVFCFDEEQAYPVLAGRNFGLPIGKEIVGFKIPRWTEQLREPLIADYGTPLATAQFYAGEPIVFMLRDVRDVVVSMMRLRLGGGTWLETWGIPTVELKIATSEKFRERFAHEIEQIRSAKNSILVTYAALYWKYKTLTLFDYLSEGLPVLPVHYEDLVSTPEKELRRVIEFLQLSWEPQILDHPRLVHGELDAEGKTIGGTNPKRPIDRASVLQWQNALLSDEIDAIMAIAGAVNERVYGQSENASPEARTVVQPLALEVQQSTLRARLSDREQSVCALGKQLAERDQKEQLLLSQVVERQQAVESLGAQLATQADKANTLAVQSAVRQQAIESISAQLATQTDKGDTLVAQVVERQQAVDSLSAQLTAQTDKVNTLVAQVAERQQAVESLSAQLTERQQDIESMSAELATQTDKANMLVAQVIEQQNVAEALRVQIAAQARENKLLLAQITAERSSTEQLAPRLKEKEQTIETAMLLVGEKQLKIESLEYQLNLVYGSRLWKIGTIYRSFLKRLQLLIVHPKPHVEQPIPPIELAAPSVPVEIPPSSKTDIIYFVYADPNAPFLEQHAYLAQLAHDGHRVFFVSTHFAGLDQTTPIVRSLGERIFELVLPGDPNITLDRGNLANPSMDKSQSALLDFVRQQNIAEAICVLQHPFWTPLSRELKSLFGWKIVYDHIGDDTSRSAEAWESAEGEGDLNITSSLAQYERYVNAGLNSILLPDASDSTHQLQLRFEALYGVATIIVLTWDNLDFTRRCLDSVLADQTYPNFQVVVVDNASSDGTVEYLRELSGRESRVHVIFNDTNLGFAAGNNLGLRQAKASEFVVLLNNDTVVPRGWLARLLRHARKPEVGLVGPVTNWTGNEARIEVSYSDLKDMEPFARSYIAAHPGQVFDIRVLAMFCVAMRRSIVDTVGLLDERYERGNFEDDDYARQVRQAGYRVICAEDVFVHHQGMASFSKLDEAEYKGLFELNKKRYEEKWGGPWTPHQARAAAPDPPPVPDGISEPAVPPPPPNLYVRRKSEFRTLRIAFRLYLANHLIANIPSFRIRHWYYRRVLHYTIGRNSSIHMGTFVTGNYITLGDNVVINRRCYLDGRIGIEIKNNVSVSPEVCLISMEHDPNSPQFATRGEKVVIENNVWIGARAIISPGITIHEGAVIGAGALVTKDIGPYRIAVGVPAREIKDRNRDIQYQVEYFPWFDTDVQRFF